MGSVLVLVTSADGAVDRASLQALNRDLLALPGVIDGAMFLPSADATRLAAVVVAPGCAKHEIRKTLACRIDPAFMPRPLILAHSLPRDGNGKLPVGELRALVPARVNAITPSDADGIETLIGSAVVPGDHPALPGHFPGHPIVPGVVLLELVEASNWGAPRLHRLRDVEWAVQEALPLPERLLGTHARFAVTAGR